MKQQRAFTVQDLKNSKAAPLNREIIESLEEQPKKKKRKFNNNPCEVNGILFDSTKEANRYKDLLLLVKAGEIGLLRLQVEYELNEGGTHSLKYVADFVYIDVKTGKEIVEDVKSDVTRKLQVYRKKKRLMKKIYGIEILET